MDILGVIYQLFIGPLELFFEVVFAISYRFIGNPGLTIIVLSLAMNFLVLPLYRRADAMQEAERERATKMKPWTDHIKKTFKGDERFMMLQTYNRQNNYKPTDALKGSVSLLLEIPFFIAAYHFLSNLALLRGVPFGPIVDLGAPDALLQIGDVSINVLPILMTVINLISAIIYMKGLPIQNKIQMFGIAAIFLVLLYGSPSGLVFYWTLNNVFSLVKNVFYRLKHPLKVLGVLFSICGIALIAYCVFVNPMETREREAIVIALGLALQLPLVIALLKPRVSWSLPIPDATKDDTRAFVFCCVFMAILTGLLIPSAVIQSSPTEFADLVNYQSPLWNLAYSFALAFGLFVIWFGVFFWLATPRGKTVFSWLMIVVAVFSVVNYLFFEQQLGVLSPLLQFENLPGRPLGLSVINLLVAAVIAGAGVLIWRWRGSALKVASACMCVAVLAMSVANIVGIQSGLEAVEAAMANTTDDRPHATISRGGKNVVVIMLDRAIGYYLPYLVNENPSLKEGLRDFTYYSNATSYGLFTNFGIPCLMGGYDYVPENMNARSDVPLAQKHDEALKVMPTLFSQNGFETTFFDPTYAGYQSTPDLGVFDDLPDVNVYITMDGSYEPKEFSGVDLQTDNEASNRRNFFCYSLFKVAPVILQSSLYHFGDYNSTAHLAAATTADDAAESETPEDIDAALAQVSMNAQLTDGGSKGEGFNFDFMKSYPVLQHLPEIATVKDGDQNTCLIMTNDATHAPLILKEPECVLSPRVDNTAYDLEHVRRYAEDGSCLEFPMEDGGRENSRLMHFQIDTAALRELCVWFDYLRKAGAWDNTRVIIVSDHGRELRHFDDLQYDTGVTGVAEPQEIDLLMANCLLMVKDFDSHHDLEFDNTFMTNADTPLLAMDGLIENPVNPFTGNPIAWSQKADDKHHILYSYEFEPSINNGNTFVPGHWFEVNGSIYERDDWVYLGYY